MYIYMYLRHKACPNLVEWPTYLRNKDTTSQICSCQLEIDIPEDMREAAVFKHESWFKGTVQHW